MTVYLQLATYFEILRWNMTDFLTRKKMTSQDGRLFVKWPISKLEVISHSCSQQLRFDRNIAVISREKKLSIESILKLSLLAIGGRGGGVTIYAPVKKFGYRMKFSIAWLVRATARLAGDVRSYPTRDQIPPNASGFFHMWFVNYLSINPNVSAFFTRVYGVTHGIQIVSLFSKWIYKPSNIWRLTEI